MIKVHDQTTMYGFAVQGTNRAGGNITCINAVNTVGVNMHDMQFITCGVDFVSSLTTTGAVDVSSNSAAGDEGALTQGDTFTHIACFYTGHCFVGFQNGGSGIADMKWIDIECETNGDDCMHLEDLSQAQIKLLRAEDDGPGLVTTLSGPLVVSDMFCHAVNGGCLTASVLGGSPADLQIIGLTDISSGSSPSMTVADSSIAGSQFIVNITNTLGPTSYGSLQYQPNANTFHIVQVDGTVGAWDAASQKVIMSFPTGGAEAEWNLHSYAFTLGAGSLQISVCSSGNNGYVRMVSDATAPTATSYATLAVGGGSTPVKVRCVNGTGWVYN
jgi:hypothetical protein